MKEFAELITLLDQSNKTYHKLEALVGFYVQAADSDKICANVIFTHRCPKHRVSTRQLREWSQEMAEIPDGLIKEWNGSSCKKEYPEKSGSVRAVKAELVFEITFEGIQDSPRHKNGIALRFPRILRWRKDKLAQEANTLQVLKGLLKQYGG